MTGFIEVRIKGDARAIIEAGSIAGVITNENGRIDRAGSPDKPISIILRGGETIEVYGETPAEVIVRAVAIKKEVRDRGLDIKCDLLEAEKSIRLAYALAIVTGNAPLPDIMEQHHAAHADAA